MNEYTAVKCSDRMPVKDGDYFVLTQHAMGRGMMVLFWAGFKSRSWNFVEYWLEKQ